LFVVLLMGLHPTQEWEPPADPARFSVLPVSGWLRREGSALIEYNPAPALVGPTWLARAADCWAIDPADQPVPLSLLGSARAGAVVRGQSGNQVSPMTKLPDYGWPARWKEDCWRARTLDRSMNGAQA